MQDQLHSSHRERALSTDTSFVDDASGDIMFKTADLEWCESVFVLNLPNSRSTREELTGKPHACCWLGLL
jgi:hypothetical protein